MECEVMGAGMGLWAQPHGVASDAACHISCCDADHSIQCVL